MADSTQNEILWGFIHYAESNTHSSLNSVHWDEIKAMAKLFNTVNYTDSNDTLTTTDPLSYGAAQDVPGPKNDGTQLADGAGISGTTPTVNLYASAMYPQKGYGG